MKQKFEESLPEYEQYKKMGCIVIGPKESIGKISQKKRIKKAKNDYYNEPLKKTKGIILNNTLYEPNIIKNLRALYYQYSQQFSDICSAVFNQEYKRISKNIYKFCVKPFSNDNGMMGSIILNTDQNRPKFFKKLLKYIRRKSQKKGDNFDLDKTFTYVYPKDLNDLEKLFKLLDIGSDDTIENKNNMLTRIIIVTNILSTNHVSFNIFIQRILEYNQRTFPKYNYILIFDMVYDPKILFDKLNVGLLSKIIFFLITTSSNLLYHEILYNFIYRMNIGFYIPNSLSLREVLTSINLHQITIESFKHYFNLILFQFFFIHHWNDDEYLIFLNELGEDKIKQSLNIENNRNENNEKIIDDKRREILKNKLNEIYNGTEELKNLTKKYLLLVNVNGEAEKLLKNYKDKMNTWNIFKKFYVLFEGFIHKYLSDSKNEEYSVYSFFF